MMPAAAPRTGRTLSVVFMDSLAPFRGCPPRDLPLRIACSIQRRTRRAAVNVVDPSVYFIALHGGGLDHPAFRGAGDGVLRDPPNVPRIHQILQGGRILSLVGKVLIDDIAKNVEVLL